ncbi:unnamed protein product [Caenorhabditis sp. 36 PRJEB53466]|nr:unnamed protein product [Caenorhabditis sp. 36 PRJEB53466]
MDGLTFDDVFKPSANRAPPPRTDSPGSPKDKKVPKARTHLDNFLRKTPLMLLEEGAHAVYEQAPSFQTSEYQTTSGPGFEIKVTLRGVSTSARAVSKKLAKQKAAALYLHEMLKKGDQKAWFIPGANEEEAHQNVDTTLRILEEGRQAVVPLKEKKELLSGDESQSIPTSQGNVPDGNWVGMVQEKHQKLKVPPPTYEDSQLANKQFVVTCTMCNKKTRGVNSTKKGAKAGAAYLMTQLLDKGIDSLQDYLIDDSSDIEDEEHGEIARIAEAAFAEQNKEEALKKVLSDKRKFGQFELNFRLPSVNVQHVHQIILEVKVARPDSPDSDDLAVGAEHTDTAELEKKERERQQRTVTDPGPKVFCGFGTSEEAAREKACQSALIHFNTYILNENL